MMQKVKNKWLLIVSFVLGILLGSIVLIVIKKYSILTFQNNIGLSINPLEIISVTINVLLAIYVTATLSKRNEQEKSDKQFLINSFDTFNRDVAKTIAFFVDNEEYDNINVRAKFKSLRIKLSSLIKIGEDNELLNKDDSNNLISSKMTEMWELFTDSPRKPSKNASKAVKDDLEYLKVQKISDIDKKHIEFEEEIFKIIFKINRK